jgi:predicted nucleotidyltransferase
MTRSGNALQCIATDLDAQGVRWALVGGLALHAHGIERPYPDIDIAIDMADDEATAALVDALRARGHMVQRVPHDKMSEIVLVLPRIAGAAPLGVLVDLLPRACGFEAEIVAAASRMTVLGVPVPVARIGHLVALKVRALHDVQRARDRMDLRALLVFATRYERELAREALRLSIERGVLRTEDPFAVLAGTSSAAFFGRTAS